MMLVVLATLAAADLPAKLMSNSEHFLGTKYVVSPLGEGEGKDTDPRIRTDAVDCLTFVETTMAQSLSADEDHVLPTLDAIRYGGSTVSYGERNHVMEAQWLPNNLKKGFLRDVTKQYAGDTTVHVTKVITEKTWAAKEGKGLGLDAEHQAKGEFGLDILPAKAALEKLKKAPDGTVIVVVRADKPSLVTRISHVGFLVHKKEGVFMRHASKTFGKVVDEDLTAYLGRNLGYAKWTVEGFALLEVTAPVTAP
jgi:hypothetical protein